MNTSDHNTIDSYINRCIGLRISDAWRGEHKSVFFELGKLHPHKKGIRAISKGKGDITLMFDCKWRIESKGSIVSGSLHDPKEIDNQIKVLIGKPVNGISFVGRFPEISVELKGGHWLQSFASSKDEDWGIIIHGHGSIGRKGREIVFDNRK